MSLSNTRWTTRLTGSRKRIYFDGFLPPAKLNTRLKRLEAQTRQSIDYYNAHPIPCRASSKTSENASPSLFSSQAPRPALTNLPAPPFLVPAILEALQISEFYTAITEIVPGEADLYCARFLKEHGGVVFTGDSDLLVHDLGPNGAVTFFKDTEVTPDDKAGALHSQIYHPAAIADRLCLPNSHGLQALAFEMIIDSHGTFPKLLAQATTLKAIKKHEKMYQDFCKEYMPLNAEIEGLGPESSIFQALDPRISEILLQFPSLAKLAGQDPAAGNPSQDTPHMFLPFLLDCPVRTSAWELSTSVRQLAYGLVNLIVPEDQRRFTVYEHRRQQKNSSGREWQLPSISEIPEACMGVVNLLTRLEEKLHKVLKGDSWLAVAMCQDVEWAYSLDKTPLICLVMEQLFDLRDSTKYHKNYSWDIIQFLAQIQGSYYSFRILKQIISFLIAQHDNNLLPKAIRLLHRRLESLRGFCDVPDLNHMVSLYEKIERNGILKVAHEVLEIEEPASVEPIEASIKSPRKKGKRKGFMASIEPSTSKKNSRNPFELLRHE